MYCLGTEIYIVCTTKPDRSIGFKVVLFSTLLFSKSVCFLELCYIYWHLLKAYTEGVHHIRR
jgi:hypothetical protein